MGEIKPAPRVKLIIGLITGVPDIEPSVRGELEAGFGPVDLQSPAMDFNFTLYYQPQMGEGLRRTFFSFAPLVDPAELAAVKLRTNAIEERYRDGRWNLERPINLDPGYLELGKLVLASTKNHYHRIFLRDGIYAEVTLYYRDQAFRSFEWTFPDYRTEEYHRFFLEARRILYHETHEKQGKKEKEKKEKKKGEHRHA